MYHYTESGLRNVWLANGYKVRDVGGEEAVAIHDVDQLHQVIGRSLARKPKLTGTEVRFLRKEMGMSQKRLADMLGSTEQTVSLWERHGRMPVGYDRLMRAFYLEFLDGNVKLREMVDRLVDLDRTHREKKAVFEDTGTGWKMAA
ncbi:helix-turn-helix domain-containing protein [Allopusillimonas ginsengisoli]|uniref:helix-turn-helix domain-containing protein n=1 Tax=Allopusillimonas ginsengisoli TaxID=453575 RepID=UPI0010C17C34|nr:helix-turn-helix domain-containing protein [Allopusillimonas ginsengisoli]